ncbi:formate/nitrite transporter family protein [Salinibacterium sp. SYSU T00001]|uniref:formate/nitrite transporter family protein n=1 Tax=Homoserinimonas sedimenticola TaxID=2986805 RepID=UPI0022354865|nr:formate/nitrite transporter family protein [Salinibacterium sedimenticola]MCW4386582.1 formate/nitrite transporter family protein [Salinibacterium sedimenticola]
MSDGNREERKELRRRRREELGETDAPVEDEVKMGADATIERGAERLERTFPSMLITGFFGGLEVGLGVMGYLAVLDRTGSELLAGLAFSIGLIALLLASSELFTENFLMPVAAVVARTASLTQLAKLWGATLVANLAGGWLFMWLLMLAFPEWSQTLIESASHFVEAPFGAQTVALALLGGSTITLMTRMQQGTDSVTGKLVAAVATGFLLAGLPLFHSVLDSLLIFGAIMVGADFGYLDWLGWFGYTLLFNILGGIVLVTALRLIRAKDVVQEHREESPPDPDAPRS